MRPILNTAVILVLTFAMRPLRAQEVGAYVGLGGAHASSNGALIETFGDGNLYKTPGVGGLFAQVGASVFVSRQVGVGAEISWKTSQGDFAGIPYRPMLYSFDAIFRPARFTTKRLAPEFRAGIGGARLRYLPVDDDSCAQVTGCPVSNHFQEHAAVAVRWYMTDHLFLRPAFDLHHVHNLFEFGSGWVPRYSFGLGYSIGKGQ